MSTSLIELVVLDMAGTTVLDGGLVERAATRALTAAGAADLDAGLEHVRRTMGQSKIDVFRAVLPDEDSAQRANAEFETAYAELVAEGHCAEVPGAAETIRELRRRGRKVAFTTGFARPTQDAILAALGWADLVDLALTPADAGRGRPYPDMVLTAVLRLGVSDVRAVAVAGDTPSDILTARRAGASVVAGVLTGAGTAPELTEAGATHVLPSVRELLDLPGLSEHR
ncbi:phosphonatase-like hydrolase [Streptoalloteichus tenebrarius]|uniref:Phosphonatase-like hydrolase n=1 Tax=Streptoalloteichus tenebrarius (strain ATCC 17920 / DSM 40477 / JCM 4838 / CBS 697.72 / NBRC 16177 / NCIMB 11028 / NRRL B-12390 / A12253. 1 / ISP 5477) TaxID=1933 RepID=A0ABT1HMS3_STRSD|nr:phosphonatase-like hydrolase [Streptoalloteichus tenebrarius]MCP2256817.1 phosphonatase-like hydrolase [Streptoalloteichus tenebrarius]BFF00275.1 phosphonatase-like hydrolase [Streptoalloteichus tenebrarius]